MRGAQVIDRVDYPESDGKPTGETDLHRDWMVRILDILRHRYRGEHVYVASDLLVYYQQGVSWKFVVPDDFVVLDCDPQRRRVFKTWEEGKAPDVVFEVTSRSSRREDESVKPQTYDQIGVKEYFLYDPSSDYLQPPLRGFRRQSGRGLVAIAPGEDGSLTCETLGIVLRLDGEGLVMSDVGTGEVLLTEAEAERAAKEAECAAKEAEGAAKETERAANEAKRAAREAAEIRVAELQAELERLRSRQHPS